MSAEVKAEPSGSSSTTGLDAPILQVQHPSEKVTEPLNSNAELEQDTMASAQEQDDFHPGFRLWVIILSLGVTLLLTALENTVVAVAGPYIVADLNMGEDYIWITNAFFICR
jgi:hypothetical protein